MQLVENTKVLCKDSKLAVSATLHHRAVSWYHHHVQHCGSTSLEETLSIALYWKGMCRTIQSFVKNCKKCQLNKGCKHKYGKLPNKLVTTNPWEALCVDLIGPYSLKGQDRTVIDFMCLT